MSISSNSYITHKKWLIFTHHKEMFPLELYYAILNYIHRYIKSINGLVWKAENAAVGFDVLTTCQPNTVWCSRERLPAAAAQPAKVRQSCSTTDYYYYISVSRIS
jgi:hypothetical protein